MPVETRPTVITLYFDQPDTAGHEYGPFEPEIYDFVSNMDTIMGSLFDGIDEMNLTDCVNIVILSDHGMAR